MLAEQVIGLSQSGRLNDDVHLPDEWITSLVDFIRAGLIDWRDDPLRPAQTSETQLTAQLCSRLNSLSRLSAGWDFLQFKREEPDDTDGRRSIDLAVAPNGSTIWLEGREYTEYRMLMPIECKRLPTPRGTKRDEREYLSSKFSSTGGVHRFKAGHHGAAHCRAAIIAYVQEQDISSWHTQIDSWIEELTGDAVTGWSTADKLGMILHDTSTRTAHLTSRNERAGALGPILLDHLWVEM